MASATSTQPLSHASFKGAALRSTPGRPEGIGIRAPPKRDIPLRARRGLACAEIPTGLGIVEPSPVGHTQPATLIPRAVGWMVRRDRCGEARADACAATLQIMCENVETRLPCTRQRQFAVFAEAAIRCSRSGNRPVADRTIEAGKMGRRNHMQHVKRAPGLVNRTARPSDPQFLARTRRTTGPAIYRHQVANVEARDDKEVVSIAERAAAHVKEVEHCTHVAGLSRRIRRRLKYERSELFERQRMSEVTLSRIMSRAIRDVQVHGMAQRLQRLDDHLEVREYAKPL